MAEETSVAVVEKVVVEEIVDHLVVAAAAVDLLTTT